MAQEKSQAAATRTTTSATIKSKIRRKTTKSVHATLKNMIKRRKERMANSQQQNKEPMVVESTGYARKRYSIAKKHTKKSAKN